jgi:cell division protein FtsZ
MTDINLDNLKPKIIVIGVGGAGGNAINNMIKSSLEGVEFMAANTDAQALRNSKASEVLQLGLANTKGLGAGAKPEVGRMAAEEVIEEIKAKLLGANMVFITAGMGGGTGTGAASVIARVSRELGILTVGVVTKPFNFEGAHRMKLAEEGIKELQQNVDTLIVIPNQNLFRLANQQTTFADAFNMVDNVLYAGVRSVTDLMIMPGLVNLDFADVRTTMSEMGKAKMGTGEGQGTNRAIEAAEAAIANPLLEEVSLRSARAILVNVTGGFDMTLFEVDEAVNRVREEAPDAKLIFGATFDDKLEGILRVAVVATGIEGSVVETVAPKALESLQVSVQETVSYMGPQKQSELNFGDEETQQAFQPMEQELAVAASPVAIQEDIQVTVSPSYLQEPITMNFEPHVEAPKKEGFFQKLGFGKKLDSPVKAKAQTAMPSVHETTIPHAVVARRPVEAKDVKTEEDLDVPAFLRRKQRPPEA